MTDEQITPQGGTNGGQGSPSQQEQPKTQPQTPPPTPAAKGDEENHLRSEEAKRYRRELRQTQQQLEEATKAMNAVTAKLEAAEKARADAEAAVAKASAEAARTQMITEIAAQYKLTPTLAKRLQGTTKEELEADAKSLAAELGSGGNGQQQRPGQTPAGLIGEQTPPSRAKQLLDSINPPPGSNPFKDAPGRD